MIALLICSKLFVQAQSLPEAKTTIYVELLGNGFLYSINAERLVKQLSDNATLGVRIGIGGTKPINDRAFIFNDDDVLLDKFVIPLEVFVLAGKRNSKFDFGVGIGPGTNPTDSFTTSFTLDWFTNIGYRFQKPDGGFVFKTALLVQDFNIYGLGGISPFVKLGFGYAW